MGHALLLEHESIQRLDIIWAQLSLIIILPIGGRLLPPNVFKLDMVRVEVLDYPDVIVLLSV